jgi:UDP-N-acetyl-alpha-D-quinovosamine dehydrogenase
VRRRLPNTVLVTGANGFLGMHISTALAGRGLAVRSLVRRPDAPVATGTARLVARGLDDVVALRHALTGVEGVVHLAARVHQTAGDAAAIRVVNLDGTRTLLETAVSTGVRDFLFVSSVKAVGETSDAPWTESTPPAPADPYGATKLEAERLIASVATTHGLHAPILRLPLVYGPGMKANALRLFDLVDRGVPLPLGSVHNRRSLLFTGNLVAALVSTLESPAGSGTFFVSDDEDLSTPELVIAIGRALKRPARLIPVPLGLLKGGARVGDLLACVSPFPFTTAALDRLVGSLAVDCSRLKRLTRYAPPYSVSEGLGLTAEWYRASRQAVRR